MLTVMRYTCPISTCEWAFEAEPPNPGEDPLAAVFGPGVQPAAALHTHRVNVEQTLRDHLETHDVEEWVAETARLARKVKAAQEEATRAHDLRIEAQNPGIDMDDVRRIRAERSNQ